ncbi:hypothetical protein M5K25_000052 [Dendrobium thyrsiflorum]|uniref:Glutaminyl-peptide cyclotransferase n=1 Tax=Dendrobium thyrsiflorum TaxID=117978 RepID=A0ABD0W8L0_DENTH
MGLLYDGNGTLLESTGIYGKSTVRKVDLQSGKVELSYTMGKSFFGEGLTLFGDRLLQVTWLTKTGFIYDRYNLSKIGRFAHPMNDGWGLATDGKVIFGSDGSSTLYLLDPVTWKARKKTTVKYNDHEISLLNELEYVNGEVLANVWQTDCIARISPDSGSVLSWILLHELRQNLLKLGHTGIDVLNGIAWDEKNKRLFVTGKLWPKLYEIRLRPVTPPYNERHKFSRNYDNKSEKKINYHLEVFRFVIFFVFVTWKFASSHGPIPRFYTFDVVNEFPHDPEAFTEGLLYVGNGTLLESTGLYGKSTVRKVDLQSGKVELSYTMKKYLFGEGLTLFGDRLFQLAFSTRAVFVYDRYNLRKIGKFVHSMTDGWGLATDGKVIFGSDGTSTLYQFDPVTWKAIKKTTVKYNDLEIFNLNELEYVNGEVLANVWETDCIARISPDSGSVLSWILLHELRRNLLKSGHTVS